MILLPGFSCLISVCFTANKENQLFDPGCCVAAELYTGLSTMSSRGGKKKSTKTSRSTKAGVIFPVGRMLRYIKRGLPKYRIGVGAPVYLAAVLEYLTGEFYVRRQENSDTFGLMDK